MNKVLDEGAQQKVLQAVEKILGGDDSGHDMGHIRRVHAMAMRFATEATEPIDLMTVNLVALLHDVDDYKLVGREQSELQTNARKIMEDIGVDTVTQQAVREAIATMGYSNTLKGIRPKTIEGKIVSDADMCDAIGASGIIRCLVYAVSTKGSGTVFDPEMWPIIDITAEQYNEGGTTHHGDSFVNHFFEKLLKLADMMMTTPGREEAAVRHGQMVGFLQAFFREEGVPEWGEFLEKYLSQQR